MKKHFLHSLVYLAAYFIFFFPMFYFAGHSPSKYVYGFIAAWMGCLWISCLFRMSPLTGAFVFVYAVIVHCLHVKFQFLPIYHDSPDYFDLSVISILCVTSFLYALPIFINSLIFFIQKKNSEPAS